MTQLHSATLPVAAAGLLFVSIVGVGTTVGLPSDQQASLAKAVSSSFADADLEVRPTGVDGAQWRWDASTTEVLTDRLEWRAGVHHADVKCSSAVAVALSGTSEVAPLTSGEQTTCLLTKGKNVVEVVLVQDGGTVQASSNFKTPITYP
jgi:hypothetical protein